MHIYWIKFNEIPPKLCDYISIYVKELENNVVIKLQNYFGDAWNTTDFILVVGSIIDIVVTQVNEKKAQCPPELNEEMCKIVSLMIGLFSFVCCSWHVNHLILPFRKKSQFRNNFVLNGRN